MAGSPTLGSLFQQKIVVGVGEMAVSRNPGFVISTYALGSCVGIAAFSSARRAGGILHLMLPDSTDFEERAVRQPAMFADTGIPKLIASLFEIGASRQDTKLFIAGGAAVIRGPDKFKIGQRNIEATRRILSVYGLQVAGSAVGGTTNRTLHLNMDDGTVEMRSPEGRRSISLA